MNIVRGERARLPPDASQQALEVRVELDRSRPAQLFAVLLSADECALDGDQVVGAAERSRCGAIVGRDDPHGSGFTVDLGRLGAEVTRVTFILCVDETSRARGDHLGLLPGGAIGVRAGSEILVRYGFTGPDFGREAAVRLLEIYRKDGWRVTAPGSGFVGGLPSALAHYRARLPERSALPEVEPLPDSRRLADSGAGGPLRAPSSWPGQRAPEVPRGLVSSAGIVVAERGTGLATGTGFAISPGGCFLTCAHVVAGARSVSFAPEGSGRLRPARVLQAHEPADLALLAVTDHDGFENWFLLAGPNDAPSLGDAVGLLGYPLGGELGHDVTYSQGVINSLRRLGDVPMLQVDAGAAPGSSGGPVFRRSDGRVAGVLTSGLTQQKGGILVNFAVDVRQVHSLRWLAT